jgi:LacI family transcriptional regulator
MSQERAAARPGPRERVTLHDIARRLDVSTATVSLALRGATVVADSTRLRVQTLARELGYSCNRSAASLRTARSDMLGVALHDIADPALGALLAGFEEAAVGLGQSLLLGTCAEDLARQERVLAMLREHRPDGILACPAAGTPLTAYDPLVAAGIPLVQVTRELEGAGLDYVGADDAAAVELAVGHLVGLGHVRIGMIGGTDAISTGRARRRGFGAALARCGLPADPALMIAGAGTRETGIAGMSRLLALPEPPTALFCFNDLVAFGAMLGLRHAGREAGRDLAVVGCDDVAEAALWAPGLTTIRTRHDEIGRRAADLLVRRIADPAGAPERVLLAPELVVRGSARGA